MDARSTNRRVYGRYRTTDTGERVYVERRGGAGRTLAILLVIAAVIVAVLFATGFFRASVSGGSVPHVAVSGGSLPNVDVDSKKVVVGTHRETVSVPTVGVTEGRTDRNGR